ncbi:MAG: AraC family transcriptional regulator [Deinococcota bacterium]
MQSEVADKVWELAMLVATYTNTEGDGVHATAIPELELLRESAMSTPLPSVYEPVLVIVVQGQKESLFDEQTFCYRSGSQLIIPVDLVVSSFITKATSSKPYLALKLMLDPEQLSNILTEIPSSVDTQTSLGSLSGCEANLEVLNCVIRLMQLLGTPEDAKFLAPLVIREIYYRLLTGEQAKAMRELATPASNMRRIAEVIKLIKANLDVSLRVEAMAETANMSISTFHRRFKEITSLSPLQYQKQYRLIEARRLMLAKHADATSAAYQVGYESPSQFSREYARMFGAPPGRDIERLQGRVA